MPRSRIEADIIRQLGVQDKAIREFIQGNKIRLRPLTLYHYIMDLEFALNNIQKPLLEWDFNDVEAYLDFMKDSGYAPSSIKRGIAALSSLFNYHRKIRTIEENPVEWVNLPKWDKVRRKPVFLSAEEVVRLLTYHASSFDPTRATLEDIKGVEFYSILSTLIFTGVRVSKLCSLTLHDFRDLDTGLPYLDIIDAKGGNPREVPLNEAVIAAYRNWLRVRPNTPSKACYTNVKTGLPISVRTVQRHVKRIAQEAGIKKDITSHKCRHTFATLLLREAGANITDIKELLGHESLITTMIYVHSDQERKQSLVNKLPSKL